MNQQQLQDLAAAVGNALGVHLPQGGAPSHRKVDRLSEATTQEWLTWKDHFLMVSQICDWNDLRKRRELYAAMQGLAAQATRDIPVVDPVPAPAGHVPLTFEAVLAAYESRLCTTAASDTARSEFLTAKQMPDETILAWHGRVRSLFIRAAPAGHQPDLTDVLQARELRERFVLGLLNREVKRQVLERRSNDFNAMLQIAGEAEATLLLLEKEDTEARRRNKTISQVNGGERDHRGLTCYRCRQKGHIAKFCDQPKVEQIGNGKKKAGGAGSKGKGGTDKRKNDKKPNGNKNQKEKSLSAILGEGASTGGAAPAESAASAIGIPSDEDDEEN